MVTRAPLSAAVMFRTALELVDAEGLEAVTMRRLANELGVAPMSLYSHVPNKDDLMLGVLNLATSEMALPDPATPPWDALRAICREFRRVSLRHPNLVPLITLRPPTGPEALRTLEASLDAVRRGGIDAARAASVYRRMASFVIGFVSLEVGGFFRPLEDGLRGPADASAFEATPRVQEAAPYLAAWDSDKEFEAGMDALIERFTGEAV